MPASYSWTLIAPVEASGSGSSTLLSPYDRPFSSPAQAHLGFGLLRPFRRDEKNDFANGGGVVLVAAAVGQVLATRCSSSASQGELRWRTDFGSLLHLLRHQNNDVVLRSLGRTYVADALRRWEPRVRLKSTLVTKASTADGGENILSIRLKYDIIRVNVPGNQVLVPDVDELVTM